MRGLTSMAELKTPQGLIVGLIPPEMFGENESESAKPVEKPARGRKTKDTE